MSQEKDRPESIPVAERRHAIWVNLDHGLGMALICEEGQHGEVEAVYIPCDDIDELINALHSAKARLREGRPG